MDEVNPQEYGAIRASSIRESGMDLGEVINEETGNISGMRVLSNDAAGTKAEISLSTQGSVRGIGQQTNWTYTQLVRPDGSVYGSGIGIMTTVDGDIIQLSGSGSGRVSDGTTRFSEVNHYYSSASKFEDLNDSVIVGTYEVASDGTTVGTFRELKS